MDLKSFQNKLPMVFQKYKYTVFVLLLGLALMLIPVKKVEKGDIAQSPTVTDTSQTVQDQLEEILGHIYGAGSIRVMLKEKTGEETVYQTDQDTSVSDTASSTKMKAITVTDSDRNQLGLVRQINPPTYQGAIVLCQGADDPSVRLAVTDAVSKITGLGADKIAVLKMK